jgi:putative solute:sodium symporter small subunit
MADSKGKMQKYWKTNLKYMVILLAIWAIVSYGCGILFVVPLNSIKIGGFPFGFWMAQQGSIYTFVVLIFVYYFLMRSLDRKYDVHE